jgi:hypothetical protein
LITVVFAAVVPTGEPPLWSVYLLTTASGVMQRIGEQIVRDRPRLGQSGHDLV